MFSFFKLSASDALFSVLVSVETLKDCPIYAPKQNLTLFLDEVLDSAGRPMIVEKFECPGGYSLDGHGNRTCILGDSRGWSVARPTCVRTSKWECEVLPPTPQTLARASFFNSLLHHYHAKISTSDLSLWDLRKIIRKKYQNLILAYDFGLQFSFYSGRPRVCLGLGVSWTMVSNTSSCDENLAFFFLAFFFLLRR